MLWHMHYGGIIVSNVLKLPFFPTLNAGANREKEIWFFPRYHTGGVFGYIQVSNAFTENRLYLSLFLTDLSTFLLMDFHFRSPFIYLQDVSKSDKLQI